MNPKSAPILLDSAVIRVGTGGAAVVADEFGLRFDFRGRHAQKVVAVLREFDGVSTIEEIARERDVPTHDVLDVLKPLRQHGMCVDAAMRDLSMRPPSTSIAEHCAFASKNMLSQPFWKRLREGHLPLNVVLGWGIEFFHFVDAANEYMPLGVASLDGDAEIRERLAKHYCEEADHGAIFLDGLEETGLARTAILDAPPLPTTSALINHLKGAASAGFLRYSLMFAVMQPAANQSARQESISYYPLLGRLYPAARPLFDAFAKHAVIDQDLGHSNPSFYELIKRRAPSGEALASLIEQVHEMSESFIFFFEGIHDYYSAPHAAIPRRALTVAAL